MLTYTQNGINIGAACATAAGGAAQSVVLPRAVRAARAAPAARGALPRPRPGAAALPGRHASAQRRLPAETCESTFACTNATI